MSFQLAPGVRLQDIGFPSAVLWDFDGTLGKTGDVHDLSRIEAARIMGEKYDNAYLRAVDLEISQASYSNAEQHSTIGSLAVLLYQAGMLSSPAPDPSSAELLEFVDIRQLLHYGHVRRTVELYPSAYRALKYFRENTAYGQAVASTGHREELLVSYEKFNLRRYFETGQMVAFEDVDNTKPHPDPYKMAARTLLPAWLKHAEERRIIEKAWAVDDSILGLDSAIQAGALAVGMCTTHSSEELLAVDGVKATVDNPGDVVDLAEAIKAA